MTLPASGVISASDINVELGRAAGAYFDINGTAERTLAGVPSGAISFSSFHGKSNFTPSTNLVQPWLATASSGAAVAEGMTSASLVLSATGGISSGFGLQSRWSNSSSPPSGVYWMRAKWVSNSGNKGAGQLLGGGSTSYGSWVAFTSGSNLQIASITGVSYPGLRTITDVVCQVSLDGTNPYLTSYGIDLEVNNN